MCHLPYNCHLHSQWARLRHTKVACHIHVSLSHLRWLRLDDLVFYFILFLFHSYYGEPGVLRDHGGSGSLYPFGTGGYSACYQWGVASAQCGGIASPGAFVTVCQVTLLASFPSLHHSFHGSLVTPSVCFWTPPLPCFSPYPCAWCVTWQLVDTFPIPTTFACWKIRFKTKVCSCSQFLTEAMLWIKEVEMVESVDDLKSPLSIRGTHGPNFELLDARIASALNKIIQNTRFKRKVSLEEMQARKEDRFLRGRQIAFPIYEHFRFTGANDSVQNHADLFTVVLRNDNVQEFDSKCDESLLSMTQIPSNNILESLYKIRIREFEKLKTVVALYNVEFHQKKAGPDYHRLKTMVKRSIEQNLGIKNFEDRNGNYETSAGIKNQRVKQREQRSLKETIAVSDTRWTSVQNRHSRTLLRGLLRSRVWKIHRQRDVLQAKAQVGKWLDCRARITSKELAPLRSVKNGILQNACSTSPKMDADLGKSALMRKTRLMNSLAKGLKRMVTKVQWLC